MVIIKNYKVKNI